MKLQPEKEPTTTPPVPIAGRVWRGFLSFLDIVGLYRNTRVESDRQLALFRLHHTEFRRLLGANDNFLNLIAELEEKRLAQERIDAAYVEQQLLRATVEVFRMVQSLNVISSRRYAELDAVLDRLTKELETLTEEERDRAPLSLMLDLDDVEARHTDIVGGKVANLGEIRNGVGLPTPDGFVATTEAFRRFVLANGLASHLQIAECDRVPSTGRNGSSSDLPRLIGSSVVPEDFVREILENYDRLCARAGYEVTVAVRSSALGEDSRLSFAGQYLTELGVMKEGLVEAYRRVAASLFSREATHYRLMHGLVQSSLAMAVGFLQMVDASCSGVVYTRDPIQPEAGILQIHAVRGLGISLVDGRTTPERILLDRSGEPKITRRDPPDQQEATFMKPHGTVVKSLGAEAGQPILSNAEALQLAGWALALESHFGGPQDIEWAMTARRGLFLLQSRPLKMLPKEAPEKIEIHLPVLVNGGEPAFAGIGSGPVVIMDESGDLDAFPKGGVLVAPRSSPVFVRVMDRAAAIVTEQGSTAGHMASLAREFHVPTLLNVPGITKTATRGMVITVDSRRRSVFHGLFKAPAATQAARDRPAVSGRNPFDTPARRLLERATPLVLTLNLTDPRRRNFKPENCRSLHDIARFIHEKSYEEMFRMGERLGDMRSSSYFLDIFIPLDLYIIDLGGGIDPSEGRRKIKPERVTSVPLKALLSGILDKRLRCFGAKPMDARGFLDIMMRHALQNPEEEATFRAPCYALVSDRYLNYTSRVGYHLGIVDTYCGRTPNKNYISLNFRGGASEFIRRERRVRAIGGILRELGFFVEVKGDNVNARLAKLSQEETAGKLQLIGSLLQFVRQADAAMVSDEMAEKMQRAFLDGDYQFFDRLHSGGKSSNGSRKQ